MQGEFVFILTLLEEGEDRGEDGAAGVFEPSEAVAVLLIQERAAEEQEES